jgi:hypothetical protein
MISPKLHLAFRHFPGPGDEFFPRGISGSFFKSSLKAASNISAVNAGALHDNGRRLYGRELSSGTPCSVDMYVQFNLNKWLFRDGVSR